MAFTVWASFTARTCPSNQPSRLEAHDIDQLDKHLESLFWTFYSTRHWDPKITRTISGGWAMDMG